METIYINNRPLILAQSYDIFSGFQADHKTLVVPYLGRPKILLQYIDALEKGSDYESVIIHHPQIKELKQDFKALYRPLIACGGLVLSQQEKMLWIYRRGKWDLPKGKRDPGETKRECAIREVEEETGILDVQIIDKLVVTRHTYKERGTRILKSTHWYLMQSTKQKLYPEESEQITKAKWLDWDGVRKVRSQTFKSIIDVVHAYQRMWFRP